MDTSLLLLLLILLLLLALWGWTTVDDDRSRFSADDVMTAESVRGVEGLRRGVVGAGGAGVSPR